jgi:hypothetical protein
LPRENKYFMSFLTAYFYNRVMANTEQAIVKADFEIIQIERESMRKAPSIVCLTIRGMAKSPARQCRQNRLNPDSDSSAM